MAMQRSESIKEIACALNKAQGEMSGAKKKADNPFFKKPYADMTSVVDAVRGPFCENGLSYSQFPFFEDGKVGVETLLMHNSGEWLMCTLLLPITKQDPQAAGSAITYAKRYALQSMAGIPSEDDDGNSTVGKADPDVSLILSKIGDQEWIKTNWSGVITRNWSKLDTQTQNKLQGK
tara:strand:+ start:221 stop:751 length:531 start_codon:yes stop_codon:yes gene_type:complete